MLFMLLLAVPMHADQVRCLTVLLSNDTKLYYPASANPVATFEGTVMHLNSDAMYISTVAKLTIETVELVGLQPEASIDKSPVNMGQTLFLKTSESDVQIFSLSGKRMQTTISRQGEMFSIDLAGLPDGTYLLKAGNQSWKFVKH